MMPISPEREAWERAQIEAIQRRARFWRDFRRAALETAILLAIVGAFYLACRFLP
jgi:hypothetical protein